MRRDVSSLVFCLVVGGSVCESLSFEEALINDVMIVYKLPKKFSVLEYGMQGWAKSGHQVVRIFQANLGISGKQQKEQNSPTLLIYLQNGTILLDVI